MAKDLGGGFGPLKTFLTSLTKRFVVSNRVTHIGMIQYSDSAVLDKPIDAMYNPAEINDYISSLTLQGNGFNVTKALQVAADYGFTIFGGTRPTAPKTFVLVIPGAIPSGEVPAVEAAARKLKAMGVRLLLLGVNGGPDLNTLKRLSTQPSRKFVTYGNYDDFIASSEPISKVICRGKRNIVILKVIKLLEFSHHINLECIFHKIFPLLRYLESIFVQKSYIR